MKSNNKYFKKSHVKKVNHPDYWLSAEKNKRKPINKKIKKSTQNYMFPDYISQSKLVPQNNVNSNPQTNTNITNNANKQNYTGVDKNFEFKNNMMNMYRAVVDKTKNY